MAQSGAQLDRELLSCSLCLDLLKDPVTTSCGHSYCRKCLQHHWDVEEVRRVYSCPQCRRTFTTVLEKNIMLAALVENLKKTGLQAAPADHKLVDPTQELQENICPHHDEVMKMFCRTDQQMICYLCSVEEHKGHDTVSAAAERTERQRELEMTRQEIQQRTQHKEEDLKVLQKEVKSINDSADKAVKDNEGIFIHTIRLLKRRRCEVQQQVRSTQEAEVSRVKDL
ncbi:E3 ubiquitin-protein ligase TRIM62-like [Nelusetta ayraudi]|uniref:E3 ubiquitin-protein ligase TRIM62-like n=1 Tax=Nelusetta ayraudi TaxID=303726 RepID=UPI003F71E97B